MAKFNPFRPGKIVGPGMFAGRADELERLEGILLQARAGNGSNFLIQGERGIGKTSLLLYLQSLAQRELASPSGVSFNFLCVTIELDQYDSQAVVLSKVASQLRTAIGKHKRAKQLALEVWDFLKRWEVMGVKYSSGDDHLSEQEQIEEIAGAIEDFLEKTKDDLDGIVFLLDEADKPPVAANLGSFLKLLTEKLTKRGCERVVFGLSGLPVLLSRLRASHESAPRLFESLTLEPLHPSERVWVVRQGLRQVREKGGVDVTISPDAEQWISELSEGYPHFIQQFAFCAFDQDTDNNIDLADVMESVKKENGAFQQLGTKYFHDLYFDQINSDEYRLVLRAMAKRVDGWVTKDEIRTATGLKATTLTNAITALKARNIIIPKPGGRGVYRLPSKAFAVWIAAYPTNGDT